MAQTERVTEVQAEIQQKRFQNLLKVEDQAEKDSPKDSLYEVWEKIIPREQYGSVSIVSTPSVISRTFQEYLISGQKNPDNTPNGNRDLEAFIDGFIESEGYEGIYRAKQDPSKAENGKDRIIADQHTRDFLAGIGASLIDFQEKIQKSDIPEQYRDEYERLIGQELLYIEAAKALGTAEFTNLQKSPQRWGEFVDVEASLSAGTIVLPFEEEARQVLKRNLEEDGELEEAVTVEEALKVFNFNRPEEDYLGLESIAKSDELDAEHIKRLLEILANRMQLDGWAVEIDENANLINVEPKAKKIVVPKDRKLKGRNMLYVPSHEIFHAVRGENGSEQGLGILKDGVDDYLTTEEGAGAVAEMIMGEQFGHERQLKFAARYLAVAMALKVRLNDEGAYEPIYTTQAIFNKLISYGLSNSDAAETVWRVMRGTSLKRKTLFINLEKNGAVSNIPASECYAKDTVYFEGQMQVFQWIKDHVPVNEDMQEDLTLESPDFSDRFLARIGLSREKLAGMHPEEKERALRYAHLKQLGRKTLIDIINILGAGKMRIDFLKDGSKWYDLLRFGEANGIVDYSDILKPRDFIKQ